jgi:phosphate transport system permease protein
VAALGAPRIAAGRARARRLADRAAQWTFLACAAGAVAGFALIFVFVLRGGLPVLFDPQVRSEASLGHLLGATIWQPVSEIPKYGLWPLLAGTAKVVLVALLFAVPVSVAAALFASEFASPRAREWIKPAVEILAGIPSVVLGFFALLVLASWVQQVTGSTARLNALNAGLALGIGLVPAVFTMCEDAFRAVPRSYREASLALGATRWQTASRVTLPAASVGVSAAVLLGAARAFGETMIVLMAAGNAALLTWSPLDSVRTISATIAAEMGEVVVGSPHYSVLFFLGGLLFLVTFSVNAVAGHLTERLRRRLAGA